MGKIPPQARELEEAVLGIILIESNAFDKVNSIINKQHFYSDINRIIFNACETLAKKYSSIDALTVVEELKKSGELENIGGVFYISQLMKNVVSSANIETYCYIILDKYIKRELIKLSTETVQNAYEDSIDVFDLINNHEKHFTEININLSKKDAYSSFSLVSDTLNRIAYLMENKGKITGILSGYRQLDNLTNGWQSGDLIILAARPSVGKTCFALNLLINAAQNDIPCAYYSLEMSANKLMDRILSIKTEIPLVNIQTGRLSQEQFNTITSISENISNMNIFIDDTSSLNIYELRSKARNLVRKNKIKVIIIDYLQLMSGYTDRNTNREQEISTISRNLKWLAKELDIPIIALSQLSRATEKRENKMPILSDLRESGSIEQDADLVMFLYRPEYYNQNTNENGESTKNEAILKFAKNRNGALDTLAFYTDLTIQKFYDSLDYQQKNYLQEQSKFYHQRDYRSDNPF